MPLPGPSAAASQVTSRSRSQCTAYPPSIQCMLYHPRHLTLKVGEGYKKLNASEAPSGARRALFTPTSILGHAFTYWLPSCCSSIW